MTTTTTWPGTVDATQTRTDGVDTVLADDFNYRDGQVRAIEGWLGDGVEDLIGDDGTSAHGPGGLASPIASGGVAITLAAKDNFVAGKLLSVGDDLDGTYSEKASIDYAGLVEAQGVRLSSTATVTSVLDEDAMTSNSATALATQQSIKAYVDAPEKDPGVYNKKQTVTSSAGAVAVDCADGYSIRHVLTESTTIGWPTNAADGMILRFFIKQTSGNSYTVSWNSVFLLDYDVAWADPVGTLEEIAVISFFYDADESKWIELARSHVTTVVA